MKTHSLVARRLLVACALMGGFGYHFATPTPLQAQSKVQSQLITVTGIVSDPEGPSIGATVMTIMRSEGLMWIGLGFLITIIPVLIMGAVAMKLFRLDFGLTCGMLCGSMANPMALNYANDIIPGDFATVSYATVYPLSMFCRVIIAQLIILFFI